MDSSNVRASELIRLLVKSVMGYEKGADMSQRKFESMVLYVNRLLSSRSFVSRYQDLRQTKQAILAKVCRGKYDAQTKEMEVRLEDLFDKLSRTPLRNKAGVLRLLLKLCNHPKPHGGVQDPISLTRFIPFADKTNRMHGRGEGSSIKTAQTSSYNQETTEQTHQDLARRASRREGGRDEMKVGSRRAQHDSDIKATGRGKVLAQRIPEWRLLKDVIYVLQGIDGKYIKMDTQLDAYAISPQVEVSPPNRRLLSLICEGGWLYLRIQSYLDKSSKNLHSGLVEQSFCGALQSEVTHYFHQIATLESELGEEKQPCRVTIRTVYLWSRQIIENLRIMAMMLDSVKGTKGGALLSSINTYLRHGDPGVVRFVRNVLKSASVPFFKQVGQWMSAAELKDPFQEFFVVAKKSVPADRLWQDRYVLNWQMVPSFIHKSLAARILQVGKSINFIHKCCRKARRGIQGEGKEVDIEIADLKIEGLEDLSFADVVEGAGRRDKLRRVVDRAADAINSQLMGMMRDSFQVRKHCMALKKYLLLGQGDFATRLLDLLDDELSEPATKVFRHNLVSVLKAAIQQTNAQFEDPDVLKRLDVRLLRSVQRDSGWDVFSLDYHIDLPLNVVLNKNAIDRYLRVFSFLWRLRRVDHCLVKCWSMYVANSNALWRATQGDGGVGTLGAVLKKGYLVRNEMSHFVSNLTSYMMFEVLECAWADFDINLNKAKDLDELINAHEQYLAQILSGALMGSEKEDGLTSDGGVLGELNKMFDLILKFVKLQEHVYDAALVDLKTVQDEKLEVYKRQQKGEWGKSAKQAIEGDQKRSDHLSRRKKVYEQVYDRLLSLEETFAHLLTGLRSRLSAEHSSSDAQFLDVRLDFNEFYEEKRKKESRLQRDREIGAYASSTI
ncbi:hypothetical protein AAMO2058_001377500 [Amorphochlora amoebiformis]